MQKEWHTATKPLNAGAPPSAIATTTFKKHLYIKSLIYFIVQTLLLIHK
jgi:hypothetical protein